MPDVAGVATGLDRLLMLLGGWTSIDQVILFPAMEEYAPDGAAPPRAQD